MPIFLKKKTKVRPGSRGYDGTKPGQRKRETSKRGKQSQPRGGKGYTKVAPAKTVQV
jgi:hypothetical protein